MRLISIQVGKPREVVWQGKTVTTGIFKEPVSGPVRVGRLNLEGDGQADLSVHGGVDKAVYGYGHDAYPGWREKLGRDDLPPGSFGENLTFTRLDESELCLGDELTLGTCRLQVAEPRFPCVKLGIKFGDPGIIKTFMEYGRPGIYFRVLREGEIRAGDELKRVVADPEGIPLSALFELKRQSYGDAALMRRMLRISSLGAYYKEKFEKKLNGG